MQVYSTNSGLGYRQIAYLIKVENGFLVTDTLGCYNTDSYIIGNHIKDEDSKDTYLEDTDYDINCSPLSGTFLFDHYIKILNKFQFADQILLNKNDYV